jgi:two-component system, cell cycle sensor histidine kinase and response regulator CckA
MAHARGGSTPPDLELPRIGLDPRILEGILGQTSARVAYFDRELRFRYATPAMRRASGRSLELEDVAGRSIEELDGLGFPLETIVPLLREAIDSGEVRKTPITEAGPDDRTTELVAEPARGPGGEIIGVVLRSWDVSALTRALARIRRLGRVQEIAGAVARVVVLARDRQTLFSEACRVAADLGGFEVVWVGMVEENGDVVPAASGGPWEGILESVRVSVRDEAIGRGLVGCAIRSGRTTVTTDARRDPRLAHWLDQLRTAGIGSVAAFPLRQEGRVIGAFTLYSAEAGHFDADEVELFEGVVANLSYALDALAAERAKVEVERALRESERRYRDFFEAIPVPTFVYDRETLRFLGMNRVALETYGYDREDFDRMTILDIRPPDDVDAFKALLARGASNPPNTHLSRHRRKDGTDIDVEVMVRDLEFDGRPARIMSASDVSERLRLERQLAETSRMEAIGRLAGGIAHDFNNLLTAVIGYAELLEFELGDGPGVQEAREIRRAGLRAADLTRQVLAFARRQVMTARPVDLNSVVGGVSQMLRRLIGEEILLAVRLAPEPAVVSADPGQLEQVLVNLAINARDAMPEGGCLEIAVTCLASTAGQRQQIPGRAVLVTVTDTGRGMDDHTLARAFDPFYTTKPVGSGTGLGLSTVYGIVHQSNGEIWADSVVGYGTRISVLLPWIDGEVEPAPGVSESALPLPSEAAGPATILVVEDDPNVRAIVVSTLEHVGFRVLVAGSPAEAVALTRGLEAPIDLLLTDMVMPESSGEALAARLREIRPSLRVMLMSGYGEELGRPRLPRSEPFLAKPFTSEALVEAVTDVLSARK